MDRRDDAFAALDRHGRLTPEQSLAVSRGALLGLAFAHDRGIVHADVAPGNVLIDEAGTSKLIDFGLAALAGSAGGYGTPAFMSPEAGLGEALTPASDVYSVAAMLFLLLEGQPPMPGPSIVETLRQHRESAPPALRGDHDRLSELLTGSMAKDPVQRPPDAGAFLAELEEAAEERCGMGWLARGSVAALLGAGAGEAMTATGPQSTATPPAAAQSVISAAVSTGTNPTVSTGAGPTTSNDGQQRQGRQRPRVSRPVATGGVVVAVAAIAIVVAVASSSSGSSKQTVNSAAPGAVTGSPAARPSAEGSSGGTSRGPVSNSFSKDISGTYRLQQTVLSVSPAKAYFPVGSVSSADVVFPKSCQTGTCDIRVIKTSRLNSRVTFDGKQLRITLDTSGPCPGSETQVLTVTRSEAGRPAVLSGLDTVVGPCGGPPLRIVFRKVYTRTS